MGIGPKSGHQAPLPSPSPGAMGAHPLPPGLETPPRSGGTAGEARLEYLPSGVLPVSVVAHRQSAGITPLPHRPVVGEHVPVIGRGVGRDEMDRCAPGGRDKELNLKKRIARRMRTCFLRMIFLKFFTVKLCE